MLSEKALERVREEIARVSFYMDGVTELAKVLGPQCDLDDVHKVSRLNLRLHYARQYAGILEKALAMQSSGKSVDAGAVEYCIKRVEKELREICLFCKMSPPSFRSEVGYSDEESVAYEPPEETLEEFSDEESSVKEYYVGYSDEESSVKEYYVGYSDEESFADEPFEWSSSDDLA